MKFRHYKVLNKVDPICEKWKFNLHHKLLCVNSELWRKVMLWGTAICCDTFWAVVAVQLWQTAVTTLS